MATLAVPSPQATSAPFPTDRKTRFRPLSAHGLPKEPRTMSPRQTHRFPGLASPPTSFTSVSLSPRSPGPLSPPMSAKSFGTFIDSEPSTPAYSPRMDHDWDSSTLVLLRPMSSCSEPSSPTEPQWEMMMPTKAPLKPTPKLVLPQAPAVLSKEISVATSLSSHPIKQSDSVRSTKPPKKIKVVDLSHKENHIPQAEICEEKEPSKLQDVQNNTASPAPLGKFASKMKLMLRRKNTIDSKKKQKRQRQEREKDYYEVEDVHWTEY